jgi:hypothetical protein
VSIVSSALTQELAQKDGRFWVEERHTDNLGLIWPVRYLAAIGTNVNALLTSRAVQIAADLVAAEIASNIAAVLSNGSLATIVLNYSTIAANRSALRAAYATATRTDAIMIGDFLSSLTDVQLQNLFGLTAGQVTTLRTNKLTPAASAAASIRAATGQ